MVQRTIFGLLAIVGLLLGAMDMSLIAQGYPEKTGLAMFIATSSPWIGSCVWGSLVYGGIILSIVDGVFHRLDLQKSSKKKEA